MLRLARARWIALSLAIILPLPGLFAEHYCDDQLAVLRLEGALPAPIPGPFHLYTFMSGEPGQPLAGMWWALPTIKMSLFRPLTSALFAIDHAIAGRHAALYHVHSMLWYAAAVLAAAALFRRLLPEREAALATLIFTITPAHWTAAAWPAARHVAIAGALGFTAFGLHVRSREEGDGRAGAGAIGLTAIAMLAGEAALSVLGFIAAYELVGRRDAVAARVKAMVPWALLFAAYMAMYKGLGFGIRGAGGYLDPVSDLAVLIVALPVRLGVLACSMMLDVPAEMSTLAPRASPMLAALGAAAGAVLILLARRAARRLAPEVARRVWALLLGAAFATLPATAGLPGDRGLFLAGIGTAAAIAVALLHAGRADDEASRDLAPRAGRALFGLVHVVMAAPIFLGGVLHLTITSRRALAAIGAAEIPRSEDVRVAGIGLADPLIGMFLEPALRFTSRPAPKTVQLLSMSTHDHTLRRVSNHTLEIGIVGGRLLDHSFEQTVRAPRFPLRAGAEVRVADWHVRVLEDEGGQPTRFSVTFDLPLDDPRLAIVHWRDGGLRRIPLPTMGNEVTLKHEPGPMGL